MSPVFDNLRNNLPSLYRPEDDDTSGEALPINAATILDINGVAPASGILTAPERGFAVLATFPAPINVQRVRLRPGNVGGSNLFLEFYRLSASGRPFSRPTVVASIKENVAVLPSPFIARVFSMRLKRPGLLGMFLKSVANLIDDGDIDATTVLQSHWFDYADSALYHPYAARFRQLSEPPIPTPHPRDPSLLTFPHIHDLAWLASLLALPPWQNPPELREMVEAYRTRIARTVALYQNGLGTLEALRDMIETQLPPALPMVGEAETPEERSIRLETEDRAFFLEPFAPLVRQAITMPGAPVDRVGALMRWTLTNDGLSPAAPTVYIEGVEPVADKIDATVNPIIELYRYGSLFPRVGLAYNGTINAGETLRLRPLYNAWLGTDLRLLRADSESNPTAPGSWATLEGIPADRNVVAITQTRDLALWVALTLGDPLHAELWRFDGTTWTEAVPDMEEVFCLLEDGDSLLIGTTDGVKRLDLYTGAFPLENVGEQGNPVYAIHRAADGVLWVGAEDGARPFGESPTPLQGTPIYAIAHEPDGTLYFGGELGMFLFQPGLEAWYVYRGEGGSETERDWQPFTGTLPTDVFLPPVRCIFPAPDASLWLGTDRGFARYVAHASGLTYTTLLEAFPDLADGRVFFITADDRGLIWFGTTRGVFRYDGRDLWHYESEVWRKLGRADSLYGDRMSAEDRGAWRFQRATNLWQRLNPRSGFQNFNEPLRTTNESAARAVAWTNGIIGEIGTWDGDTFTPTAPIDPALLRVRFKPTELTIQDGGIPGIPRLPVGVSTWRYLSLEPEIVEPPRTLPAWTIEGRLIPPPEDRLAPPPGRFDQPVPAPPSIYDDSVYAFNPSARVWFDWNAPRPLAILARLKRRTPDETIDPAILDRVRQGVEQVRPAGVRVVLAVEDELI